MNENNLRDPMVASVTINVFPCTQPNCEGWFDAYGTVTMGDHQCPVMARGRSIDATARMAAEAAIAAVRKLQK
jgi:hypothetical protein